MSKPVFPILAFLGVLGIATLLVGGMVVRPWELPQVQQVNLAASQGYGRSMVSYVGSDANIGWQQANHAGPVYAQVSTDPQSTPPIAEGEHGGGDYFTAYGCAACHGIDGWGTRWAPMRISSAEQVHMMVRIGPGGMPAYTEDYLPDSTVDKIASWLLAQIAARPAPPAPPEPPSPPATSTPPAATPSPPASTPSTGTPPPPSTTPEPVQADPERGEELYSSSLGCSSCHGKGGIGSAFAPALDRESLGGEYGEDSALVQVIREGKGMMAGYGAGKLSDPDLADLIAYLRTLE